MFLVKEIFSIFLPLFFLSSLHAQEYMVRSLDQLINKEEPGWELVESWMKDAKNKVEVLAKDNARAEQALLQAQVTTRSPLGAIIYETGGILVNNGWLRILGSGSKRLDRSVMEWNKGKSFGQIGEQPSFLLVADDVLGGFFAINNGGISATSIGKVFYFAPDNLKWEETQFGYSDFIGFCFTGDLQQFYDGYYWDGWEKEITSIDGSHGVSCIPFLFTREGHDINKVSREIVPIQELWDLYFNDISLQQNNDRK